MKGYRIKNHICLRYIVVLLILVVPIIIGSFGLKGGDALAGEKEDLFITGPTFSLNPYHTLSITDDGQLEIDGKPVERMSDPEIKAILKEIAESLRKSVENNSLIQHYDRQTGYLLKELEKCLKSK